MVRSLLVVVTGAPGVGKTTIAKKIAAEMALPLFARDDIKERLFDTLGWSDRQWSRRLGAASWEILYYALEGLLKAGCSLIVEGNFRVDLASERLSILQAQYGCQIVQVLCETDEETRFQRFRLRAESGARHPGHVDHLNTDEFRATLPGEWQALAIDGTMIRIDTTDWDAVDTDGIVETIRAAANAGNT